jgi:hypothetical protein
MYIITSADIAAAQSMGKRASSANGRDLAAGEAA